MLTAQKTRVRYSPELSLKIGQLQSITTTIRTSDWKER